MAKKRSPFRLSILQALLAALLMVATTPVAAQPDNPADPSESHDISLNFPENLELKVLVEYVSQRLGTNILYDEQVGNKRVSIKSPTKIPKKSLLGLLKSTLKMKGLALIDAEQPGWKRIVPAANLVAIARSPEEVEALTRFEAPGPTLAVTRVFALEHADTKKAEQVIKPFLTQPGANSLVVSEHRLLIVTDYTSNMPRIAKLIQLVDRPVEEIVVQFVPVEYQEASKLAQQASKLIQAKLNAENKAQGSVGLPIDITHDDRTNQLVIVGTQQQVVEAINIIKSLDITLNLKTQVYQFEVASPEQIDRLTQELIGPLVTKRLYRSAVDQEAGLLVVATTQEVHDQIQSLKEDFDIVLPESQNPIRFYKLTNTTAADVLETIRSLEDDQGLFGEGLINGPATQGTSGPDATPSTSDEIGGGPSDSIRSVHQTVGTDRVIVAADTNTNSLIVVAPPRIQSVYADLIKKLDRRRPQVLIEVTIVTLDTSDGFSLGVEISRAGSVGDHQTLGFSSFGISGIDPVTGVLSLLPGLGFNGAIIGPDVANIVIRALSTSSKGRIVSAPRILVNDNATGTLSSVLEVPFDSFNVGLSSVSTTTFGGFEEAGTTITMSPHISEGDHLTLEYSITLNSFSGGGNPPPRQTNSVESNVTVPDGHTVVVGGLNLSSDTTSVDAVPLLGQIPILKHLFTNESQNESSTTMFIFVRPIILRDDQFADLKGISHRQLALAELPGEYPTSEPMTVH